MAKPDLPVETVYNEVVEIIAFLNEQQQPSLSTDLDKSARKVVLLSAASFFEHEIISLLKEFATRAANDERMAHLLYNQGLNAKYHTLFSWGEKNNPEKPERKATAFFRLFGEEFRDLCIAELKTDADADQAMKDFLEIGHLRNILVHNNFGAYSSNRTTAEVFALYTSARRFITYLRRKLIDEAPIPQSEGAAA
jgi:hypothetical protein